MRRSDLVLVRDLSLAFGVVALFRDEVMLLTLLTSEEIRMKGWSLFDAVFHGDSGDIIVESRFVVQINPGTYFDRTRVMRN